MCKEQSRSMWLKDGDINFEHLDSVLTSCRRGNAISTV
jgi:hypothetical protein